MLGALAACKARVIICATSSVSLPYLMAFVPPAIPQKASSGREEQDRVEWIRGSNLGVGGSSGAPWGRSRQGYYHLCRFRLCVLWRSFTPVCLSPKKIFGRLGFLRERSEQRTTPVSIDTHTL